MNNPLIPFVSIRDRVALKWREALWALEHGLIDREAVIELAVERVTAGSDVPTELDLAILRKSELDNAEILLRKLADAEPSISEAAISRKWTFLKMASVFDSQKDLREKLSDAERAYADLGYPREVEEFMATCQQNGGTTQRSIQSKKMKRGFNGCGNNI